MLHLIPASIHRTSLRIAYGVRKRWWRIRKPDILGCRVIALDRQGRILLIRHSYGSDKWMPPGGGVDRNEDPIQASVRELREETGCILCDPRQVAMTIETLSGAGNHVHVVAGWTEGEVRADGREVIEARFFRLDCLPPDTAANVVEEIPVWAALYDPQSSES